MSPADEKALLQQGIAAARAGDKAAARARFRELTARNFDNELAWLWLASVADTPAHAIACLRRVLQINPAHDKARAALFRVLMEGGIQTARSGDKAAAHAAFGECAAIDPNSELVWTWMASTAPSPALALEALRRVLQINAAHEQAGRAYRKLVVQHGIDLAQAGDPGARALLTEASHVDPQNIDVWLWLARAVSPDDSVAYYERVLELNPDHEAARSALQRLRPEPEPEPETAVDEETPEPLSLSPHLIAFDDSDQPEEPELALIEGGEPVDDPFAEPAIDGTSADVYAMDPAVEQFSQEAAAAAPSGAADAATQEQFLVYQSADISTVWSEGRASDAAAADGEALEIESVEAIELEESDAVVESVAVVETTMVAVAAGVDEGVEAADVEEVDEVDAIEEIGEIDAVDAAPLHVSDVDSYVAASESTYASSEWAAATHHHVHAAPLASSSDRSRAADVDDLALNGTQRIEQESESEPAMQAAAASDANGTPETPAADPPAAAVNAPIAWNCPICLSGAPESATRCPSCGSVANLLDPDLLLDTDPVDRRHVLQVIARIKNRKVSGKQQFDHHFALGLAYINAGRLTEGIGQLRTAQGLQKDPELKSQIDSLERRAALRAKQAGASKRHVNGKAAKAPEPAVVLPMAASTDAAGDGVGAAASPHHGVNGNASRRLILIVDDSPTIQKVVSVTLEAHGHEVVTASDGMEALSKLRTIKPDLVLLDITMPHMDGYQLCRILRSNDLTRQVPIVMLSGKDGLFDKMRGRMAGAASYITKPFAPSALPPLVEKYCKRAG